MICFHLRALASINGIVDLVDLVTFQEGKSAFVGIIYIYRTHLSIQKKSRRSSKSQKECILLRPLLVASDATVSPWIQHVAAEVKVFHHHRWSRLLSMLFINVHDHSRVKECSLQAQNLKVNKRKRTDDIDRMPDWFSHSLCIPLYSLLAPPTSPKTF